MHTRLVVAELIVAVALPLAVFTAEQRRGQTPGQVRPRPAEGRQPEFPPPSITEYKPKSMLVTQEHLVPRAKYPAIDIHSHPARLSFCFQAVSYG